jgi:hypothetical protein
MSLLDAVMPSVQQLALGALQKGLANPIKSVQSFMNKLDGVSNTLKKFGLGGMLGGGSGGGLGSFGGATSNSSGNAYARQNVLQLMQSRKDPLLTVDWIGIVLDQGGNPSIPWHYIDEIQTPSVRVGTEPVFRAGLTKKYATAFEIDNANMKIFSDASGQAFNFVNSWTRSTRRQDGLWNLSSQYKKDIVIYLLDSRRSVVVDIRLIGCFPSSWNSYNLEASGSNHIETQLDLSVDDFYINVDADPSSAKSALSQFTSPLTQALGGGIGAKLQGAVSSVQAFRNAANSVQQIGNLASKVKSFL